MNKLRNAVFTLFAGTAFWGCASAFAPAQFFAGKPQLRRLYFNLYTDSLKPVLNYYVNVEGEMTDGSYLPLDTTDVLLTASWGRMQGNEWVIPKVLLRDSVTFCVTSRRNPRLSDSVVVWIQKYKDPRDAPDYEDPQRQEPTPEGSRRRK